RDRNSTTESRSKPDVLPVMAGTLGSGLGSVDTPSGGSRCVQTVPLQGARGSQWSSPWQRVQRRSGAVWTQPGGVGAHIVEAVQQQLGTQGGARAAGREIVEDMGDGASQQRQLFVFDGSGEGVWPHAKRLFANENYLHHGEVFCPCQWLDGRVVMDAGRRGR